MQLFSANRISMARWYNSTKTTWLSAKKSILRSHFIGTVPTCESQKDLNLVIVVCSAPQNFAARQAIRGTWGKQSSWTKSTKVFFIIGRSSDSISDMFVFTEQQEYGDVIHYDLLDSYFNLTLKSVSLLKWVTTSCTNAKFVMKSDDDMFVNVPVIFKTVIQSDTNNDLVGKLIVNARPIRDRSSKWFVPEDMYSDKLYPSYLSGTGYVMSLSAAILLHNISYSAPYICLEDVFITGICAKLVNIKPKDNHLFTYAKQKRNPCKYLYIATAHRMTPNDLYDTWDMIQNTHFRCAMSFWNTLET
ncbi:beta-1,3-galactosyltransferase 1-like isoform X2 [Argiope bruennichi]|nr:beta-1,3-galactosyltransferase 1-like isoform X2 [Argiope bruennichi]